MVIQSYTSHSYVLARSFSVTSSPPQIEKQYVRTVVISEALLRERVMDQEGFEQLVKEAKDRNLGIDVRLKRDEKAVQNLDAIMQEKAKDGWPAEERIYTVCRHEIVARLVCFLFFCIVFSRCYKPLRACLSDAFVTICCVFSHGRLPICISSLLRYLLGSFLFVTFHAHVNTVREFACMPPWNLLIFSTCFSHNAHFLLVIMALLQEYVLHGSGFLVSLMTTRLSSLSAMPMWWSASMLSYGRLSFLTLLSLCRI